MPVCPDNLLLDCPQDILPVYTSAMPDHVWLPQTFEPQTSLIGGNTINFFGTIMLAYSRNFGSMFMGRFIMGLGAGIAFMGPELYASEVEPALLMLPFPLPFLPNAFALPQSVHYIGFGCYLELVGMATPSIFVRIFLVLNPLPATKLPRLQYDQT